jgi:hypothetical protein
MTENTLELKMKINYFGSPVEIRGLLETHSIEYRHFVGFVRGEEGIRVNAITNQPTEG